eukprot:11395160-Alexandrium_andersonii.AAC.1
MDEVEMALRASIPLALTPVFSFGDIEYADDTVIVAKTAKVANFILRTLQKKAGERGLELNKEKTAELAINSDEKIFFEDGTEVPRQDQLKYLG